MELVEDRVLLSAVDLRSAKGAADAEVFQVKKSAVLITSVSGNGVKGGMAVLTATLTTAQGVPLAGRKVYFQVRGVTAGSAITDSEGVAMRYLANLRHVPVGTYTKGVGAGFAGNSVYKSTIVHGLLLVSSLPATLSGVSVSGVYGGVATIGAMVASRGTPIAGLPIQFQLMGQVVGTATTDSSGVATLANVSLAGITAGSYANAATASYGGSLGYTRSSTTGLLVVSPAPLTVSGITAANKVYDGTTTATVNAGSATLDGVLDDDQVTLNSSGATGVFASKNVGTGINVIVSGLTLTGADAGDYVVRQPTTTANITAAPLTVTGITAENKPYDGTTTATLNTGDAALVGVMHGDAVTLNTSLAVGTFVSPEIGNGKTVLISGLTISGAQAGDYDLIEPTATADITAGIVTVTGITANNMVYNGTTVAMINTSDATLNGVASGDDVTLVTTGATGTFATADVGNGITVTISGLSLTGSDASKYTLEEPTTTANITPVALTVTGITAANKPYDGTTAATLSLSGATLDGVLPIDTVTLVTTGASGAFATPDVGTGITVTVSGLSLAGADAENYTLTEPTTTANITPALVDVNGITAANKPYDGTTTAMLNTSGAVLVGVVHGDSVTLDTAGATGAFATPDVGTGINVIVSGLSLTGADAGNYSLTEPTTTANITARALDVTGITAMSKVYDSTTTATINTSGATLEGVVPGETVTLVTSGATGAFATPDVGTGITVIVSGLSITGADATNYSLTEPTTTANITARALDVTGITAMSKPYDGTPMATLVTSGATLEGVVMGDTVTLVTTGAMGTFATPDVGTGITVIVSGLSLSGADAGNYSLSEPTTTANITPATLTVSGITAANKIYDGTTMATLTTSGATLDGVVHGDTVTLVTSGAKGAFATPDVGMGVTVIVSGLSITGADATNYSLTEPTTTANITPKAIDVLGITAANMTYDGSTTATLNTSGATLEGVVMGDTVTLVTTGAMGTFVTPTVGTGITVIISGLSLTGADSGNYSLSEPTTTANITPAPLDVAGITADNMTYNGSTMATLVTSGATLEGVVMDDTVTLDTSAAMGTFATKDAGVGITVTVSGLTLAGADAGNYILVEPTTTANITPAPLTVTGITADNRMYDGMTDATLVTSGAMLVTPVSGDDVTLDTSGALGTFATKDVGNGITVTISGLMLTGADAGNYSLTEPTTTANITAAMLTVTGITADDKVYDGTTAATLDTSDAMLMGVVMDDDVVLDVSDAVGTFANAGPGTGIVVTISGLVITGADAGNYILVQPTTTANITSP